MASNNGWTPVRRGKTYCSPRCGAGCTHAAFRKATADAAALAKRMGGGWRASVLENMGWHWRIVCGPDDEPVARLSCDGYRKYEAMIRGGVLAPPFANLRAAHTVLQFYGKGTTPEKALDAAIDNARACSEGIMSAIASIGTP